MSRNIKLKKIKCQETFSTFVTRNRFSKTLRRQPKSEILALNSAASDFFISTSEMLIVFRGFCTQVWHFLSFCAAESGTWKTKTSNEQCSGFSGLISKCDKLKGKNFVKLAIS